MWDPGLYKENINLLKIGTYRAKIYPKHISSNLRHHAICYSKFISEIHAFKSNKQLKAGVLEELKSMILYALLRHRRCCLWQKEETIKHL